MALIREKKLNFQKFYVGRNPVSSLNESTTNQVIESIQLDGYVKFPDIKKDLHSALFDFGFTTNVKVNPKFRYFVCPLNDKLTKMIAVHPNILSFRVVELSISFIK